MQTMNSDERKELLSTLKEKHKLASAKVYSINTGNNEVFVTVLFGGLDLPNPKSFMDRVVSEYVEGRVYNEYVDIYGDNLWLRIIVEDINELIN